MFAEGSQCHPGEGPFQAEEKVWPDSSPRGPQGGSTSQPQASAGHTGLLVHSQALQLVPSCQEQARGSTLICHLIHTALPGAGPSAAPSCREANRIRVWWVPMQPQFQPANAEPRCRAKPGMKDVSHLCLQAVLHLDSTESE